MARDRNDREDERDDLALAPPRMTVLSDRPLRTTESYLDHLNLAVKLGPVYDILRHHDTQTPLAIAVYGDWGTGKTSAMRWLEGLLARWNDDGEHDEDEGGGKIVRPVWFSPWKYHDKEDVWRGLIAEVIIASIDVRGATVGRIKKAVKEFGLFLGRGFLHVLSHLRVSAGVGEANASLSMQAVRDIYEDWQDTAHPEGGYLNEFEHTLRAWIRETISDRGERMVIFIDDLDRCMPEVALQVLEALKLYLDIDDLIFVVGVDRQVIDQLVREHYARLGLAADKSRSYLAKMFQVEVTMAPSEAQAEHFLDRQLAAIGAHTNEYWSTELDDDERDTFRRVVLRLAQRNPREIKRLLNSALIHGAGVLHVVDRPFRFAQGVQVYLVRKILEERYTMGLHVDTKAGMEFFHEWSRLVQRGAPPVEPRAEELAAGLLEQGEKTLAKGGWTMITSAGADAEPDSAYRELLRPARFAPLLRLLADRDLGELMHIAYPSDTTALAEATPAELPQGLIREAIARELGKSPVELSPRDYPSLLHLELKGEDIADLSAVTALTNLVRLEAEGVPISDIAPVATLSSLRELGLALTQVSNLGPLVGLVELERLSVSGTRVADLAPLEHLRKLRSLSLANTKVTDLGPLRHLTQLESLNLSRVEVADISPLAPLRELRELSLANTKVTDLGPVSGLSRLEILLLDATAVSDLSPLFELAALRLVSVRGTEVDDAMLAKLSAARPGLQVRR
ncbi:P-loop NTPase fold protein [Haliangium sp.]|uniref:P-loop NTPase fold protein n=1 Tax=Haliangium sp. TaxID=2663208 RepID=UPI003D09DEB4